jgi:hypothetical protein
MQTYALHGVLLSRYHVEGNLWARRTMLPVSVHCCRDFLSSTAKQDDEAAQHAQRCKPILHTNNVTWVASLENGRKVVLITAKGTLRAPSPVNPLSVVY